MKMSRITEHYSFPYVLTAFMGALATVTIWFAVNSSNTASLNARKQYCFESWSDYEVRWNGGCQVKIDGKFTPVRNISIQEK